MKTADRYTIQDVHINDLPDQLEHASALGLKYFVTFDGYRKNQCRLFIFFDAAGMENYLTRVWGDEVDRIREIVQQGIEKDERYVDTLDKIKERLGFTKVNAPTEVKE